MFTAVLNVGMLICKIEVANIELLYVTGDEAAAENNSSTEVHQARYVAEFEFSGLRDDSLFPVSS